MSQTLKVMDPRDGGQAAHQDPFLGYRLPLGPSLLYTLGDKVFTLLAAQASLQA